MPQTPNSSLGVHFLDTGPLLCLGGSNRLAEMFDAGYLSLARVVEAVVQEIRRKATEPPPQRGTGVRKAARAVQGRYRATLLTQAIPSSVAESSELCKIRDTLSTLAQEDRPNKGLHPSENLGEAECIHWAVLQSADLVTCDAVARKAAHQFYVTCWSFVDVVRVALADQTGVRRNEAYRDLLTLERSDINTGEHIYSQLDLDLANLKAG